MSLQMLSSNEQSVAERARHAHGGDVRSTRVEHIDGRRRGLRISAHPYAPVIVDVNLPERRVCGGNAVFTVIDQRTFCAGEGTIAAYHTVAQFRWHRYSRHDAGHYRAQRLTE